jgi:hypothetical protein
MTAAAPAPEPVPIARTAGSSAGPDTMLDAIDALLTDLQPRLVNGLVVRRDNPGKTPQQWSITGDDGTVVLSFGLIDRTFFWTWDGGVTNHYAKSPRLMTRVITGDLLRFGHLAR